MYDALEYLLACWRIGYSCPDFTAVDALIIFDALIAGTELYADTSIMQFIWKTSHGGLLVIVVLRSLQFTH